MLDSYKRHISYLRISVTDRCNLACSYCMPEQLAAGVKRHPLLSFEEMAGVVRILAPLGISKIRLTGGEPLVRKGVDELVRVIAEIDGIEEITMTTNGQLLATQAERLAAAGLDRVTVSLDAIDDTAMRRIIDTDVSVDVVLDAMDAAEAAGLGPVKINAVIRRGWNEDQVLPLVERFRGTDRTVRFIEFMDVGTKNSWDVTEVVPSAELVEMIGESWPMTRVGRSHRGEVAEEYRFDDGEGSVGFISSVSQPFCADCTRLRLSAEGSIYTCLFASDGTDLKGALRSPRTDAEIADTIAQVWRRREDRYSEVRGGVPLPMPRVEMSYIGG